MIIFQTLPRWFTCSFCAVAVDTTGWLDSVHHSGSTLIVGIAVKDTKSLDKAIVFMYMLVLCVKETATFSVPHSNHRWRGRPLMKTSRDGILGRGIYGSFP